MSKGCSNWNRYQLALMPLAPHHSPILSRIVLLAMCVFCAFFSFAKRACCPQIVLFIPVILRRGIVLAQLSTNLLQVSSMNGSNVNNSLNGSAQHVQPQFQTQFPVQSQNAAWPQQPAMPPQIPQPPMQVCFVFGVSYLVGRKAVFVVVLDARTSCECTFC